MNNFETNIINIYGKRGEAWLADLPRMIKQAAGKYCLSDLKPVSNWSYNYVLSGVYEGKKIIVKLGLDIDGLHQEAECLKTFAGCGAVELLTENNGMLLLECAIPGHSLKTYFPSNDGDAMQIMYEVMTKLHQAKIYPDANFPHIRDWLSALDQDLPITNQYLHKARRLRDQLLTTCSEPVLLHGDLHHDNILQHLDGWVAIDPKGVIGEPCYEVTAFIRNPMAGLANSPEITNIINNRIEYFAKIMNIERQRILDWCFVQAVLAWAWALEDGADEALFKQLTQIFYEA